MKFKFIIHLCIPLSFSLLPGSQLCLSCFPFLILVEHTLRNILRRSMRMAHFWSFTWLKTCSFCLYMWLTVCPGFKMIDWKPCAAQFWSHCCSVSSAVAERQIVIVILNLQAFWNPPLPSPSLFLPIFFFSLALLWFLNCIKFWVVFGHWPHLRYNTKNMIRNLWRGGYLK